MSIDPRSVAVFEEQAGAATHAPGGGGQSGVTSALLGRVAQAAGIGSHWHDIYGKEHIVPDATKQALLADMGLGAGSNAEARESLGRLADWESRRSCRPRSQALKAKQSPCASPRVATGCRAR